MFKLRRRNQTEKKKPKVRPKSGGKRENKPIEKRQSRTEGVVRKTGTPVRSIMKKKKQEKKPAVRLTPTEVVKSMNTKGGKK
ncbi:MAG: hypothetical protein ACOX10_01920 [Candidatus Methanomethylophilaceae archaeon]|jgi:hypothetical protein|nr:hypothetical protein [Candidatus Methanomethylophilaceae archaeon]